MTGLLSHMLWRSACSACQGTDVVAVLVDGYAGSLLKVGVWCLSGHLPKCVLGRERHFVAHVLAEFLVKPALSVHPTR